MTRGRVKDKTYTGHMGVATDKLRAIDALRKRSAGQFGKVAAPDQTELRAFIEAGTCPWCGRGPYKVLATHTLRMHAVTGDEIRELAGLFKGASICDPELSATKSRIQAGRRLPEAAYEQGRRGRRKFSEAGRAVQREKSLSAHANDPNQRTRAGRIIGDKILEANAEKHAEIVRLFAAGDLFADIGVRVGMHARSVARILRREGLLTVDGRRSRSRNQGFREQQAAYRAAADDATRAKSAELVAERLARYAALGANREALRTVTDEWGISVISATAYLRKHGAHVPDGRR